MNINLLDSNKEHSNSKENMSWQEEYRRAIRSHRELESFFNQKFEKTPYPVLIPLNLAKKIKEMGIDSVLGQQYLPQAGENSMKGYLDPIGDHEFSPIPGLVHRYKNRVLFFPTGNCPVICRYCFRKNELSSGDNLFKVQFDQVRTYLANHDEVEEIIFSGGDPFILSDDKIKFYLSEFEKIKSIKYIRFHTRTPVIMPSRFTQELREILYSFKGKFSQLQIVIHINHADEVDPNVELTLQKLNKLGISLLSQSVFLKGINNNIHSLKGLIDKLISLNIRPYYLHHPDQVKGANHFNISLKEGRNLYALLRNIVPGWALPIYIIDIPGGEGKVNAFNPEGHNFGGQLLNKDGNLVPFIELE